MERLITTTHVIEFNAAHATHGADPVTREASQHGHLYRLAVTSADCTGTQWLSVDRWVDMYLHMRDLDGSLNFVTTPAAITSYLLDVFLNFDPHITEITLTLDACDSATVTVVQ